MTKEEAIKIIESNCSCSGSKLREACAMFIPELAESEDERIRKSLIKFLTDIKEISESGRTSWAIRKEDAEMCKSFLTYLEKQKCRLAPIYKDIDSFESALGKAWKDYNDSGARIVDGCEDDYVECAHAKGFREGYLFGIEKQKEHLTPEEKMNHPLYLEGFDIGKRVGEITGKPAEWSEKKEFISDMISERLKSLRPQPHTVSIKDATKFGNLEYERGVKDGIQSEKKRHWKPSEEQMRAVFDASERNDKLGSVLRNLYGDLKKL